MANKNTNKISNSSGPKLRKKHSGPKRRMFKEFKPMIKLFADAGLLDKYHNYESFCLACNARGKRNPTRREFTEFTYLTRKQQEEYFKSISKQRD